MCLSYLTLDQFLATIKTNESVNNVVNHHNRLTCVNIFAILKVASPHASVSINLAGGFLFEIKSVNAF